MSHIVEWGSWLWGWAGVSTAIGIAAIIVAVLTPEFIVRALAFINPNIHLRSLAVIIAAAAFSFNAVAGKFYHDGLAQKQAEWDAAKAKGIERSEKARTDAESSVDSGRVRDGRYERP